MEFKTPLQISKTGCAISDRTDNPIAFIYNKDNTDCIVEALTNYPKLQDICKELVEALEEAANFMDATIKYAGGGEVLKIALKDVENTLAKAKDLIK